LKTQTVASFKSPLDGTVEIVRQTFPAACDKPVKRISFVAGLHGDELEGVYLCHRLIETLRQLQDTRPLAFRGDVHVYPAVNSQALGCTSRLSPFFRNDMNRQMGDPDGSSVTARLATALLDDLQAVSDIVVDFHASNLHLKELPQIRIIEGFDKQLVPLATLCNMDLIWVHPSAPVFESTLGYNLNRKNIPTLVVETGICLRIHQDYCEQILQGMIHLMRQTGVLDLEDPPQQVKQPLLVTPRQVALVQADHAGLFVGDIALGARVSKGEPLGKIVDAVQGKLLETVTSPVSGVLFTLREQPVTYQGAPLARIALKETGSR
jgi:uncharacterized protein